MKKLIFGITFLIFVSMSINAQTNRLTKIYFTADEYSNNTPYIFGENVKIRLDPLFKPAYVLIKSNQNKKYFLVDSIWGYSINKHVFRLYKRRKYSLINNNGIFLYEFNNPGRHFRLEYYFSNSPKGPVELLTVNNLETSFKDNTKFIAGVKYLLFSYVYKL